MCICLRLTGIASLLIGLHLFSPKLADTQVELSQINNVSPNQLVAVSNTNGSQRIDLSNQFSKDFNPPDNSGPDNTRGSGTR
jgi:hypothetical protein